MMLEVINGYGCLKYSAKDELSIGELFEKDGFRMAKICLCLANRKQIKDAPKIEYVIRDAVVRNVWGNMCLELIIDDDGNSFSIPFKDNFALCHGRNKETGYRVYGIYKKHNESECFEIAYILV